MTDQPTQSDRERALGIARYCLELNVRISDLGAKAVCGTLLAAHAENERLRAALTALHAENERLRAALTVLVTHRKQHSASISCGECFEAIAVAQTQEPTMTETQAETGPSDGEAFYRWWPGSGLAGNWFAEARRTFAAGRASLAGELAASLEREQRTRVNLADVNDGALKLFAELEAEKAALAQERVDHQVTSATLDMVIDMVSAELEAARQARVMPSREELAEAISAALTGPVPTYDTRKASEVAADAVLRLLAPTQDSGPVGSADAATREDAGAAPSGSATTNSAQPTGASSDPPVPLPDCPHGIGLCTSSCPRAVALAGRKQPQPSERYVPSVGERPFCREAPPDSEIGQMHEIHWCGSYRVAEYGRLNREQWLGVGGLYNWHAATVVAPYGDLGVKGWRRAEPQGEVVTPHAEYCNLANYADGMHDGPCRYIPGPGNARPVEPAADPIEALSNRVELAETAMLAQGHKLAELELQGRVLKTAILDTRYGGLRDERAHHWFARIEREERAKPRAE